jgi:hypothetical protein
MATKRADLSLPSPLQFPASYLEVWLCRFLKAQNDVASVG